VFGFKVNEQSRRYRLFVSSCFCLFFLHIQQVEVAQGTLSSSEALRGAYLNRVLLQSEAG